MKPLFWHVNIFDKEFELPYNSGRLSDRGELFQHINTTREEKNMQFWQFWIGLIGALIMAGGLGGIYYLVIKQNASLGIKTIQFLAIVFVLPLMLILGVFNVLGRETIGTLLGVIVGYVLSGFGKDKE